ncbi:unnamed protein product, partial [Oikopleura dioica]
KLFFFFTINVHLPGKAESPKSGLIIRAFFFLVSSKIKIPAMRRFLLFLSLLAINLVTVSSQKVTSKKSAKKRKKRNKPPPEETEIAGAWLEGCADCNIWLPGFVKSELELWQNLGFKDKRGSSKLLLKFHNSLKDVLLEMDISSYPEQKLIELLKSQGFYRKQQLEEEITQDQAKAPYIKYKWPKEEL